MKNEIKTAHGLWKVCELDAYERDDIKDEHFFVADGDDYWSSREAVEASLKSKFWSQTMDDRSFVVETPDGELLEVHVSPVIQYEAEEIGPYETCDEED